MAKLSYQNTIDADTLAKHDLDHAKHVAFFDNHHAQAWIFQEHNELIITFRGTDSMEDAIRNVVILPTPFIVQGQQLGKVHKGYLDYYLKLKDPVMEVIAEHCAQYKRASKLTFVGHSLGGCVVMCALEAAVIYEDQILPIDLYTFGAPAMGNLRFKTAVQQRLRQIVRVVYDSDIVPRLPIHEHLAEPLVIYECHGTEQETTVTTDPANCVIPARTTLPFRIKCVDHHNMDNYVEGIKRKIQHQAPPHPLHRQSRAGLGPVSSPPMFFYHQRARPCSLPLSCRPRMVRSTSIVHPHFI